ncbi:hypothetical protein ACPF7Z_11105 [Halomonas sp. GXIMD04776]|uniref:hypothetical protein n=1 Tax=Halomonas sp. GXIMD04776 TaxID=3415605 RepID=UPI003C80CADB
MTITREALAQAARQGAGLAHLSPGQAWAAHDLGLSPESLQAPLSPHLAVLLERKECMARRAFFDPVAPDDAEAMIRQAHDETHPMFLRGPILETLREGMSELYPGLKPTGVNDDGQPLYNLANLAEVLGASEDDLLDMADEKGIRDSLHTGTVNPLH